MRIKRIRIGEWRHFRNLDVRLGDDAGLVCLVGANGTGKSHMLELIAACAHRIGLAPGVELPRGDPFNDRHDFSLEFHLAPGISEAVDNGLFNDPSFAAWDRSITVSSQKNDGGPQTRFEAGGIVDANASTQFANRAIRALGTERVVNFLSLDADRAYPDRPVHANQMAEAYETDWEGIDFTRGRSFRTTTTLYEEWKKYFLARENQNSTNHTKAIRRARLEGQQEPAFEDHFEPFKNAVAQVLPHVVFTGIDSKRRTLLFDTTGRELTFNQLSGGEREIAFLIGQIDRFGLRQGLLLLDEPELHLNADLIRTWVSYLTSTVENGQIWLATHSLEAVEAAGQHSTFLLERNEEDRNVDSVVRLDQRPILSALSRAVGTPAFSISQMSFIFVEGQEGIGERERFRKLAGLLRNARFMECGSCEEVIRRVATIRHLAVEAETEIRLGGIIDRDFRPEQEAAAITERHGVFVLPVHEIENFFLHPPTLNSLLQQNGRAGLNATQLMLDAADARAGSWIFQYVMATRNAKSLPEITAQAKEIAKGFAWAQYENDREATKHAIVAASGFDQFSQRTLSNLLEVGVRSYSRRRVAPDLWKHCEGKQVLNAVAMHTGFSGSPALIEAALVRWNGDEAQVPGELTQLREYLNRI